MLSLPRALNPATNAPGWMAAASTMYAATVMIVNAVHHHGVIDPPVIVAAAAAVAALFTRTVVTPVADPRDGTGRPLVSAPPAAGIPAAGAATSTGTVTLLPPGPPP